MKSVADEASRHPETHVFHGNMEFQQTHGAKELWRPRKAVTKYGLYRMPVNHPTVFVRSSCYRECGVFDTRYRVAADYGLMLKFLLECGLKFHYIDSTLAVMRGGGASNRYTLDTLREVGAILKERRIPKTVLMRGMLFYLRLMFLQFFSGVWPLSYLFSLVRALRTRKMAWTGIRLSGYGFGKGADLI